MEENTHSRKWEKMNAALINYKDYLKKNKDKPLDLIDLLYISNFKGGNAAVCESEETVNKKLEEYDALFLKIREKFGERKLEELVQKEVEELCKSAQEVFALANNDEYKIDGFKESYLSALMHVHFPDLLPIIDRRVMVGSGIITKEKKSDYLNGSNQLKNISFCYPFLVNRSYHDLKKDKSNKSLRDLDKHYFIQGFLAWMRKC